MSKKVLRVIWLMVPVLAVWDGMPRHACGQQAIQCDTVYHSASVEMPAKPTRDINRFFRDHLSIDTTCFGNGITGTFLLGMILTKEGKVVDPIVLQPVLTPSCEKVIKELLLQIPAFIPARRAGKAVCSEFKIPLYIHFQ